jgi:hypothetical protein
MQLGWMNLYHRRDYFTCLLVYKGLHDLTHREICKKFNFVKGLHNYPTRASCQFNLIIPKPNLSIFKQSLVYNGSTTWNTLPTDMKTSVTLGIFKMKAKNYFTEKSNAIC